MYHWYLQGCTRNLLLWSSEVNSPLIDSAIGFEASSDCYSYFKFLKTCLRSCVSTTTYNDIIKSKK